jgi:fructosamine-3-kinase
MPQSAFKLGDSNKHMWSEIGAQISQATGTKFEIGERRSIGGGDINRVYAIANARQSTTVGNAPTRYLLKLNQPSLVGMFVAETRGLLEMAATETIRVPTPICTGVTREQSYLVLEYLDLTTAVSPQNWTQMGRDLAAMHRYRISERGEYGWHINNTIGLTPQINTWDPNWAKFFTRHRIDYQLQLAQHNGGYFPRAIELVETIPQLLAHHQPQPSLVHGDLWSGNASFMTTGIPTIYDPATYWGDREVDLALSELFGGFPAAFYEGYQAVYPIDRGYSQRKILYNLYHILNHYNLFGGGYQAQANSTIENILK